MRRAGRFGCDRVTNRRPRVHVCSTASSRPDDRAITRTPTVSPASRAPAASGPSPPYGATGPGFRPCTRRSNAGSGAATGSSISAMSWAWVRMSPARSTNSSSSAAPCSPGPALSRRTSSCCAARRRRCCTNSSASTSPPAQRRRWRRCAGWPITASPPRLPPTAPAWPRRFGWRRRARSSGRAGPRRSRPRSARGRATSRCSPRSSGPPTRCRKISPARRRERCSSPPGSIPPVPSRRKGMPSGGTMPDSNGQRRALRARMAAAGPGAASPAWSAASPAALTGRRSTASP